ncbi:MAG: response regulator [Planctomycetes bacterium]|nr:response regulator [Planctomycetota bacterium]
MSEHETRKPHVLIVEDDPDTARTFAVLLESWGYVTQVAHDGEKAMRDAAVKRPDAVVLDIGLPIVNGYEVARQLRDQYGTQMPIIAVTGRTQPLDRIAGSEEGIDFHIAKPADPEKIREMLDRLISNPR